MQHRWANASALHQGSLTPGSLCRSCFATASDWMPRIAAVCRRAPSLQSPAHKRQHARVHSTSTSRLRDESLLLDTSDARRILCVTPSLHHCISLLLLSSSAEPRPGPADNAALVDDKSLSTCLSSSWQKCSRANPATSGPLSVSQDEMIGDSMKYSMLFSQLTSRDRAASYILCILLVLNQQSPAQFHSYSHHDVIFTSYNPRWVCAVLSNGPLFQQRQTSISS